MEQAAQVEPTSADLHFFVGEAYRFLQNYTSALEAYEKSIEVDPFFAPAYVGRVRANLKLDPSADVEDDLQTGAGDGATAQSAEKTLRIPNDTGALDRAQTEIESFYAAHNVPVELLHDLRLVMDEVLSNVMQYGYGNKPGDIEVLAAISPGHIRLVVRDRARPFNPLEQPEPDFSTPADDRSVGGLGVYLVRQLMDRVEYAYENGENRLVMERRITR